MSRTSASASSNASQRSLHSNTIIDPAEVHKLQPKATSKRTQWTPEEEAELIAFLITHKASSGDNNFKAQTFKQAAEHIVIKFPLPATTSKGYTIPAAKTGSSCSTKWSKLKKLYNAILDLKNASGMHYDNDRGANICDATQSMWDAYLKVRTSHPEAQPFSSKGFQHFQAMEALMPSTSKGGH
ncbi:hypothetical protein BU15DRAFT_57497, partial [Melanogaster broomeanus]